jgi:hypothetical protein
MRLKEYIDKSTEQEDPKALIMRAINTSKDAQDLEQSLALFTSLSQDMDNDDVMFIKQYFDEVWAKMQSQIRKIQ